MEILTASSIRRIKDTALLLLILSMLMTCSCSQNNNAVQDTTTTSAAAESSVCVSEDTLPASDNTAAAPEITTGTSAPAETEATLNELPNGFYELDGRISHYKIVIGEHEHDCIDTSDNALMELGNGKLIDALKIFCVMRGFVPVDNAHTIPAGTLDPDDVYYELSPGFGTYDAVTELADNTFVPGLREWQGYYAAEKPSELSDNNAVYDHTLSDVLERSMKVVDGRTYLTKKGYLDGHTLKTKIVGVISSDDSNIEYLLCTVCLDESPEALAVSEVIPQFYYEHSIMKLVKKDDKWLISQIRFPLGNEEPNNESFLSDNNILF